MTPDGYEFGEDGTGDEGGSEEQHQEMEFHSPGGGLETFTNYTSGVVGVAAPAVGIWGTSLLPLTLSPMSVAVGAAFGLLGTFTAYAVPDKFLSMKSKHIGVASAVAVTGLILIFSQAGNKAEARMPEPQTIGQDALIVDAPSP